MSKDLSGMRIEEDGVSNLLMHDIPYRLGKYEIKNELGRGTCGIVYRGYDPFVRRDVAIKVGWGGASSDEDNENHLSELDFFTEAHAAGKLQHPNIVSLFDAQMEKELSYIVMEYVDGVTLAEYCKKDGERLPLMKAMECIIKCCHALDFSHHMGVIHRDIKPSNIMLTKDGETKLMDFSVAEVTQKGFVTPEMIIGSPSYMSPEQVLRKEVSAKSDIYSLGAVLYQLIVGETLFPLGDMPSILKAVINTPAPTLKSKLPDLPQSLSDVIEKSLKKDPAERYESGKEMAEALELIYESLLSIEKNIQQDETVYMLSQLGFFANFDIHCLKEVMSVSSLLSFKQGEIIGKNSEIEGSYYIVVEGSAVVLKIDKVLLTLNRGDCFGEPVPVKTDKLITTLMAKENTFLLKINAMRVGDLSMKAQMLYFKAFTENLISRLSVLKKSRLAPSI